MNTYIQTNGTKTICRFMLAPKLKHGFWWVNVSKLGAFPMVFVESKQ